MTLFNLVASLTLDDGGFIAGINNASSTFNNFGTSVGNIANGIFNVASKIGSGLLDVGKSATSLGMNFEKITSEIRSVTQYTESEMAKVEAGIRKVAKNTGQSVLNVAESSKGLIEIGGDINLMLDQMEHGMNLAIATGTDAGQVFDFTSAAMKTFNMEAEDTQQVMDSLAMATSLTNLSLSQMAEAYVNASASAHNAGLGMDELNSMLVTLSEAGLKGGAAGTSLNAIFRNLQTPTKKAAEELNRLNIALYDTATGASRDMFDIMRDIEIATAGMTAEQANLTKQLIFDSVALKGWNMLAADGVDVIAERTEELRNSSDAFDGVGQAQGMAAAQTDNFIGSINRLKANIDDLKLVFYDNIQSPLKNIADLGISYIDRLSNAFLGAESTIHYSAKGIEAFANAGLKGEAAGTALNAIMRNLKAPTEEAVFALHDLNVELYDSEGAARDAFDVMKDLETQLGALTDEQRQYYEALIFDSDAQKGWNILLREGIENAFEMSNAIEGGIVPAVREMGSIFADAILEIAQAAPQMIEIAGIFITEFTKGLIEAAPQIYEAGKELIFTLAKAIFGESDIVTDAFKSIFDNFERIIQSISDSGLLENISRLFVNIGVSAAEAAPSVAGVFTDIVIAAIHAFSAAIGFVADNIDIILPLFIGLKGASMAFGVALKGLEIFNTVKGFLSLAQGAGGAVKGFALLKPALAALTGPIGIVIGIVAALATGFSYLYKNNEKVRESFDSGWKRIQAAVEPVVEALRGAFDKLKEAIAPLWEIVQPKLENFFAGALGVLIDIAVKALELLADVIVLNINNFTEFIEFISNVFSGNWEAAWENVKNIFSNTINFIDNLLGGFPGKILSHIASLPGQIKEWGNDFVENGKQAASDFVTNFITFLEELPEKIGFILGYAIVSFIGFFVKIYELAKEELPKFIDAVGTFMSELPGKIWNALVEAYNKVKQWLSDIWNTTKTEVPRIINDIATFFKELPGKMWTSLLEIIQDFKNWYNELKSTSKTKGSELIDSIMETMRQLPGKIKQVGIDFAKGLWEGINSMAEWVVGKVQGFIDGIVNGAKAAMDSSSPSRRTAEELGKPFVQGVGVGITDNAHIAINAAVEAINDVIDTCEDIADSVDYVGNSIPIGIASGISSGAHIAINAASELRNELVAIGEDTVNQINSLGQVAAAGLAYIQNVAEQASKVNTSIMIDQTEQRDESVKHTKETDKQKVESNKAAADASGKAAKSGAKATEDAEKERLDAIKKSFDEEKKIIEKRRFFNEINTAQEIVMWENVLEKFKDSADQREEIERKLFTLRKQWNKEIFDDIKNEIEERLFYEQITSQEILELWENVYFDDVEMQKKQAREIHSAKKQIDIDAFNHSKKWIDERKYYNELSLEGELAAYGRMMDRHEANAERRKELEREIYRVKRELEDRDFKAIKNGLDERRFYNQLTTAQEIKVWEEALLAYEETSDYYKQIDKELYTLRNRQLDENLKELKDSLEKRKFYNELSLEDEYTSYLMMSDRYEEGSKQREEIDRILYSLRNDMRQDDFNKFKEDIDKRKFYNEISIAEEISLYEKAIKVFSKGTNEREEAERTLYSLRKKQEEDLFNSAKAWIDKRKHFNQIGIADELRAWQDIHKQYMNNVKIREEAERNIHSLKLKLRDEEQRIQKKINDAEQKYWDAYEKRTNSIMKTFGNMFAEISEKEDKRQKELRDAQKSYDNITNAVNELNKAYLKAVDTGRKIEDAEQALIDKRKEQEIAMNRLTLAQKEANKSQAEILTENLQKQLSTMEKYSKDIMTLMGRGILSDSLLKEIKNMGASAHQEVEGLAKASDEELKKYNDTWIRLADISKQLATDELKDMREQTNKEIQGFTSELNELISGKGYETGAAFASDVIRGTSTTIKESENEIIKPFDKAFGDIKNISTNQIHDMTNKSYGVLKTFTNSTKMLFKTEGAVIGKSFATHLGDSLIGQKGILYQKALLLATTIRSAFNTTDFNFKAPVGNYSTGLNYVPYDNFLANLHRGEMVIPAKEAAEYRAKDNDENNIIINQYFYGVKEEQTAFEVYKAVQRAAEGEFK